MRATDPIPSTPERKPFTSGELVEYNDGSANLLFAAQGDRIAWGERQWADPIDIGRAIVRTVSGNRYVVGGGLVIKYA